MQHPMMMTIRHARQKLVQKAFKNRCIQPRITNVQILFEILVEKFKYQSELSFRVDDVVEADDVGMLELLEAVRWLIKEVGLWLREREGLKVLLDG